MYYIYMKQSNNHTTMI